MRQSKAIISLSIAFFASALGACGAQVEVESRENTSVGALKPDNGKSNDNANNNANNNPECVTGVVQHSSCTDPSDLKMEAYEICLQSGLTLTDLQYDAVCDGWKTDSAQYECCALPPAPPPNPTPSTPGEGCSQTTLGDGQTCINLSDVKQLAYDACLQDGLMLYNIYANDVGSCGPNGALDVGYECCVAPPPPPPPVVCLTGSVGDGQTCQNLGNFKQLAHDVCLQAGLMLFDIGVADVGSCNPDEGLLVDYKCTAQGPACP